ncbi:MAG TPA: ribulose phosphate epimerase [Nannocystaceae bacterium]|nr:ribulose phosphate epimerase [Nannocystaceae bacterium]
MSTSVGEAAASTAAGESTSGPASSIGFIEYDDAGEMNDECDLWKQDCPPGEKCMPWSNDGGSAWNATRCSPIARDPKQPGEPCTAFGSGVSGIDDCDIRAMCWNLDAMLMGYCVAFCMGSPANPICENPCQMCPISGEGVLILCLPNCDPLLHDCPEGEACVPDDDRFHCFPDASGEMGAIGDPCEYSNVCDPGLFCANSDAVPGCASPGCCAPFCDVAATDVCDTLLPGTSCVPWSEVGTTPEGCLSSIVGACVLPV